MEVIMSKDKYLYKFWRKIEAIVFIILQIFAERVKKILRTAYCIQLGIFSFECSLVRLNEQKRISLFCNNHKTLSHLRINLKRSIVVVDVRFEN